jgi:hypothetical protein
MRTLVINCSSDYNLGTEKIANWLRRNGHEVTKAKPGAQNPNGYDAVYLSALYTWDIPTLTEETARVSPSTTIEIGGPAPSIMASYVFSKTGITPTIGLDPRFASEGGNYKSTYTSRGCIRSCKFCSVPQVEGTLRELPDFTPAPIILDPNFLACSKIHIENATEKLVQLQFVDFLHGLDARLLEPWHVELFTKQLNLRIWRFTFDSLQNEPSLRNTLDILKNYGIKPKERVIVYCIYGFTETPEDAYERAKLILKLGTHPYAMRYQPMDALSKNNSIPPHWTSKKLRDFDLYCNVPTMRWLYALLRKVKKTTVR